MADAATGGSTTASSTTTSSNFEEAIASIRANAEQSMAFERGMAEINQRVRAEESEVQYQIARDNAIAQLIQTITRG